MDGGLGSLIFIARLRLDWLSWKRPAMEQKASRFDLGEQLCPGGFSVHGSSKYLRSISPVLARLEDSNFGLFRMQRPYKGEEQVVHSRFPDARLALSSFIERILDACELFFKDLASSSY